MNAFREYLRAWRAWRRPYTPRHCNERALDTLWRIRVHEMAMRRAAVTS